MARRTKIPIIILLGILFFFIAVSLYRGCSVIEGNILLKYFQTVIDLQKCKNKDKKKAEGGGDAEAPKPRDPKKPACTAPGDYNTNCTGYGEDMIKLYTETFIPSRIQEGLESSIPAPDYGLTTAYANKRRGVDRRGADNLWSKARCCNETCSGWPGCGAFYSMLARWQERRAKSLLASGEQQQWKVEGAIKDIKDVHTNIIAKNKEIERTKSEGQRLTDISKATSDALKIASDGLGESIHITSNLEGDINGLSSVVNKGNLS